MALARHAILPIAIVALALALTVGRPADHTVDQRNSRFVPEHLEIRPGDSVRWLADGHPHNIVSGIMIRGRCTPDGHFSSGGVKALAFPGLFKRITAFVVVFDRVFLTEHPASEGRYPYCCQNHGIAGMTGTISIVRH